MTKKSVVPAEVQPDCCFAKELAGENPPSFSKMQTLYEMASDLYGLQPWRLLDESELVLVRDRGSDEICHCSVMGALGEVFAMHAYIGDQSYRLFRRLAAGEVRDASEFFASQHSVYVDYVPRAELLDQDRKLLSALGHPTGRGLASPVFRAVRPGFHPWFVTQEEAETLIECIRAMILVCAAVSSTAKVNYWDKIDTYPMVTRLSKDEQQFEIKPMKLTVPGEPPMRIVGDAATGAIAFSTFFWDWGIIGLVEATSHRLEACGWAACSVPAADFAGWAACSVPAAGFAGFAACSVAEFGSAS